MGEELRRLEDGLISCEDVVEESAQVTLHALKGELEEGGAQIMKVRGAFKKKVLNILVDPGRTHNFVDLGVVKGMNINVENVAPVKVTVVDGRSIIYRSMMKQFSLEMQGHMFTADFYIITLGGCEMVLGVKWLAQLGDIV
ncbi:hypothetical protein MLD38_018694 [Melastoma candidum]|uniref:Uncharacterized protein n=1 Tax=Melastoma candidum TaxID=119954 RepID=A0ACB9QWI7_9MYRT|nr:hypothetical protein MLD38_018694 [Melastoma candidum]